MIWKRENIFLTDDRSKIDMNDIVRGLRLSHWANNRAESVIRSSWEHSALVFAMYLESDHSTPELLGFCRVVSDCTIQAYLADVFVFPEFRRRGLAKWMLELVLEHPELRTVRWLLHTRDMHPLYRKIGFTEPDARVMAHAPLHLPETI